VVVVGATVVEVVVGATVVEVLVVVELVEVTVEIISWTDVVVCGGAVVVVGTDV
jgi:hypothetical protein